MRLSKYIQEKVHLPKKKWVSVPLSEIDSKMKQRLWDMYVNTYQSIGLHIENANKLTNKYKISWMIDVDKDDDPDAFVIYKETKYGNKIALLGSDNKKLHKRLLVYKVLKLLKTKGWYIEASHKLADIFVDKHVNIIKNKKTIETVLNKPDIQMINDEGLYKRKIGQLGYKEKRLFGNIL